jgi:hypothetical protein
MMTEVIDLTPDGITGTIHNRLVACITDVELLLLNLPDVDPVIRDRKLKSLRRLCYDVECQIFDNVSDPFFFNKLLLEVEACRDGIAEIYKFVKQTHLIE